MQLFSIMNYIPIILWIKIRFIRFGGTQATHTHTKHISVHIRAHSALQVRFLWTIAQGVYNIHSHIHILYTRNNMLFRRKKRFARNLNDVINGAECKRDSLSQCLGAPAYLWYPCTVHSEFPYSLVESFCALNSLWWPIVCIVQKHYKIKFEIWIDASNWSL